MPHSLFFTLPCVTQVASRTLPAAEFPLAAAAATPSMPQILRQRVIVESAAATPYRRRTSVALPAEEEATEATISATAHAAAAAAAPLQGGS